MFIVLCIFCLFVSDTTKDLFLGYFYKATTSTALNNLPFQVLFIYHILQLKYGSAFTQLGGDSFHHFKAYTLINSF